MRRKKSFLRCAIWFYVLMLLCIPGRAMAQMGGGTGSISGQIVDTSGAAIPGAKITVHPTGGSAVSDNQGHFTIPNLAAGAYTLTVNQKGFTTFTKKVTVTSGQEASISVTLTVAGVAQQVVVHGVLQGEAAAVHIQQVSPNIVNAISAQQIASLPNASIADAIGRLPGVSLERDEGEGKYIQIRGTQPRMNQVTVDGITLPSEEANVSEVKLDAVPADLVSAVVVNKTLSANEPGNAIGGSADLHLREATDTPTISINGMGGFIPIANGRHLGQIDATIGERFGPNKRFGAIFTGSFDYNGRAIDDMEPSPDPGFATPYYDGAEFRQYLYNRQRYGYAGSLDYRLGPESTVTIPSDIYLHYFYSAFDDDADVYHYVINDGDVPDFNASDRREDFFLGMLDLGGTHQFSKSVFSWNVSAANGRQLNAQGDPGVDFPFTGSQTCGFDQAATKNPNLPQWDCPGGPGVANPSLLSANSFVFDPTMYSMGEVDAANGPTDQVNLQASAAYSRDYTMGSHSGTFEVGFKFLNEHKYQNTFQNIWFPNPNANPSLFTMSNFLGGFRNNNYYFGDYPYGPTTSWSKVINFFNQNPGDFVLDTSDTNLEAAGNFNLFSRITAGFIMNTLQFGRFRLQTGLRFEGTQEDIHGFQTQTDANGNWLSTSPTESTYSYVTPLPSVQLKYLITDNSDIRAVYGRGLSRPEPYDLVPYVQLCRTCSPPSVSYGNPALLPEHANDYDLLYEHYIHSSGVIQGGFFYKDLIDPIYYTFSEPETTGPYAGYQVNKVLNGSNAHVLGLELAYMQHFSSLPGMLSGLALNANYTYSQSQSCGIPGRMDCPPLQRQTPNIFNIIPSFTHGRLFADVGLTYQGSFLDVYSYQDAYGSVGGAKGPGGDDYFFPHFQVGTQISFNIGRGFTPYFQGENLTNEVFGFYNGEPQYVIQREYYGPEYQIGFRWSPNFERK